jgi:NAD(P)-dependent dehydrogenase (short-subunit alcohol dehydrogenase family)
VSNVLITGCSSGFGLLTAQTFARRGHCVFATVRDLSRGGDLAAARDAEGLPISILQLDLRDGASIQAAVGAALDAGPLDVLINNAGYALAGAVEEIDDEELLAEFDTNVFGLIRLVRAVAPGMREQRAGTIVNVSTLGVYGVPPFSGLYVGSKAAVGAVSEALRHELRPFGVRVILVEPGAYATKFVANMRLARGATAESPYHEPFQQLIALLRRLVGDAADPQQVADAIYEAVASNDSAFRYPLGTYLRAPGFGERLGAAYRSGEFVGLAEAVNSMLT